MRNLYLYGASGHAKVILEIAELCDIRVAGLIDANPAIKSLLDYPVTTSLPDGSGTSTYMISIGDNAIRKRIAETGDMGNVHFTILAHPQSTVSSRAQIGEGTVVMAGATLNSEVQIGRHCIINTNASVDHDCVIDNFVHISPNAALAGNVHVGEGTHIGIGASVIQGVRIGRWATIGAGAVIIRDVPDGATVVGNPGRIIKNK